MKVFCFPYAGGNADFYAELAQEMSHKGVEIIALDYPGHGSRRREEFLSDFDKLSDDLLSKMRNKLDGDTYALMGYSMGSITVTEVVKKIIVDSNIPNPKHIFLAAHEPETLKAMSNLPEDMQEDVLRERTISFGAIPKELINNRAFWRMYMPLYKVDYGMICRYNFDELDLSTDIAATVFYSEKDTPYDKIVNWSKYYKGNIEYFQFEGNHFFIVEHVKAIAEIMYNKLFMVK